MKNSIVSPVDFIRYFVVCAASSNYILDILTRVNMDINIRRLTHLTQMYILLKH